MLSYRAWHEYDRLRTNDPPEARPVEAGDRAAHRITAAGRRNGFTPAPVASRGAASARADGPHGGRPRRGVHRLARAVVLASVLAAVLIATFALRSG